MAALTPTARAPNERRNIIPVITYTFPYPVLTGSDQLRKGSYVPIVAWTTEGNFTKKANGSIYGVVKDANANSVDRATVVLHYRGSFTPLRTFTTGPDGAYRFDGLDPLDIGGYYALAFHPSRAEGYNLAAFDLLTPVATS